VLVATAAVGAIQPTAVQQNAPPQTDTVITTAARIFSSPLAVRALPEQTAALATATIQAAVTQGNSTTIATISDQAVRVAEQLVAVNPTTAINLAARSVESVRNLPVQQAAPTQSLDVAVIAARILIRPEVQQVLPETRGQLSTAVLQISNSPPISAVSGVDSRAAFANLQNTQTQQNQTQGNTSPLTPAERFNDVRPPSEENLIRRGSPT